MLSREILISPLMLMFPAEEGPNVLNQIKNTYPLDSCPYHGLIEKPYRFRKLFDLLSEVVPIGPKTHRTQLSDEFTLTSLGKPKNRPGEKKDSQEVPFDLTALLVDDEPINRRVMTRMLERLGIQCHTAISGAQAIERLSTTHYPVIFTDLYMDEVSGLQLVKHIRSMGSGGDGMSIHSPEEEAKSSSAVEAGRIVVIGMTADPSDETRRECIEAGMDTVLTKPISTQICEQSIRECLAAKKLSRTGQCWFHPFPLSLVFFLSECVEDPSNHDSSISGLIDWLIDGSSCCAAGRHDARGGPRSCPDRTDLGPAPHMVDR